MTPDPYYPAREDTPEDIVAVIRRLVDQLGGGVVASITRGSLREVDSWQAGNGLPGSRQRASIRVASAAFTKLRNYHGGDIGARLWLLSSTGHAAMGLLLNKKLVDFMRVIDEHVA